jgi:hypothetical protein
MKKPMTSLEKYAAQLLRGCTFLPGSYNKRFARNIHAISCEEDAALSDKQRNCLWRLVYRYRRQIPDQKLIAIAKEHIEVQKGLLNLFKHNPYAIEIEETTSEIREFDIEIEDSQGVQLQLF